MTVTTTRKYNPGFLSDAELIASFCVRTCEFESIVEMLRECTGRSNKHQIVIGPRGSGKTSLLLRVAAEVRRDADLAAGFFPIVFAEESYEVGTAGEFWLECLARLADQAPKREDAPNLHRTLDDMRAIRDDRQLGERCLATVLDFADREDKRLVLMVENLNMMFQDIGDRNAGWRLRKVLQTEPRIILLASATNRFDEIDQQDHALYRQLREVTLHRLTTEECAVLWETVSGQKRPQGTIRSLEILTGGSPRLLAIVARFGAGLSFRALMDNLLDLVDDHTEYFKSHLESLPPQERRVYLAVAELWKPALTKEIAERARIETSVCSAQLKRLVERGAVLVAGGSARRKQYYLSERMYNIYYLMRRSRGQEHVVEVLIRFMASYYSRDELKEIGTRMAGEIADAPTEMKSLYQSAYAKLMALAEEPREMQLVPVANDADGAFVAHELLEQGIALVRRNCAAEALDAFDELLYRFDDGETPELLATVANGLVGRGVALGSLNRLEDELTTYGEVLKRFGESSTTEILAQVAKALLNKGLTLDNLNRPEEALTIYDEVARRFGDHDAPELLLRVAQGLFNKAVTLGKLDRQKEALAAYDEVFRRFSESHTPELLEEVAKALFNKAVTFGTLNQPEQELDAYDNVLRRFGESDMPAIHEAVAKALLYKGITLGSLNRSNKEVAMYEELLRRFGDSRAPEILECVAEAIVNKGITLSELNRPEEALAAYELAMHYFERRDDPALLEWAVSAHVNKLQVMVMLERPVELHDVETLLKMLPKLDELPAGVLDTLKTLSLELGSDRMLKLIQDSPATDLLLPLTTALEREAGLAPRVPEEVSEVAEDIRRDLAKMREA